MCVCVFRGMGAQPALPLQRPKVRSLALTPVLTHSAHWSICWTKGSCKVFAFTFYIFTMFTSFKSWPSPSRTHTHTHTQPHTHTHEHTYTHAYTHAHAQALTPSFHRAWMVGYRPLLYQQTLWHMLLHLRGTRCGLCMGDV